MHSTYSYFALYVELSMYVYVKLNSLYVNTLRQKTTLYLKSACVTSRVARVKRKV